MPKSRISNKHDSEKLQDNFSPTNFESMNIEVPNFRNIMSAQGC